MQDTLVVVPLHLESPYMKAEAVEPQGVAASRFKGRGRSGDLGERGDLGRNEKSDLVIHLH